MGKESLERRLGVLEGRLDKIEAALPEQAALVAKIGAVVSTLAQQANDLPGAVRTAIDELWTNQISLDWKTNKILSLMLPEEYADPGPPPERIVKKEGGDEEGPQEGQEAEGTAAPQPSEGGEAAVPEVR